MAKLDQTEATRIVRFLREPIEPADDPRLLGKALKDQVSPLWRYRVRNYRLICELKDGVVVLVVHIGHQIGCRFDTRQYRRTVVMV